MKRLGLLLVVSLASACGDTGTPAGADAGPSALCNPLVGDDCITPFPSTFFEPADSSTETGVRVNLPLEIMPKSTGGVAIRPDRLNEKDGFSPSSPYIVYFKAGVDASQLPRIDQIGNTLVASSPVQLVDYDTGERVPVYAELDWWAQEPQQRQALIIYPMKRLKPATRYVTALVGLRNKSGAPLAPAPFVALRDGNEPPAALEPHVARFEEIFAKLTSVGVARAQLSLAWDVVTASDEQATGQLVQMRDTALALVAENMVDYTVDSAIDFDNDPNILREIDITMHGPSFLQDDELYLNRDGNGRPLLRGFIDVPVTIAIPRCAATAPGPIPYLIFGHGLFGNGRDYLKNGGILELANRLCIAMVATDWWGLSTSDISKLGLVLADLNNIYLITDRLQQGHVNTLTMTRLFKTSIYQHEALQIGDPPHVIIDPTQGHYLGVSLGGVQGGTFMALQKDIDKGILAVPGCTWSFMIFRSTNFNQLYPFVNMIYPDPLDRQLLVAASQSEWDYADPASFAPHLLADPLAGTPAKKILIVESIGDAQVPNTATRVLARTMGITGLDLVQPPFGIPVGTAPLASAYTQWDTRSMPLPPVENHPLDADNGAHGAVLGIDEIYDQGSMFYAPGGEVQSVCPGGVCICPEPTLECH